MSAKKDLTRPIATPSLTGVRALWDADSVASGLAPERLAALLKQADEGDGRAYLRLALEMEQRDAHYRSVLATRKRAVTRLPLTVESATDEAPDVALADEIRALTVVPGFRSMLGHALDALGKGYAAIEIRWDTSRTPWVPRDAVDPATGARQRAYEWIDPRWFRYAKTDGRTLRLLDETAPDEGLALPPYRFIVHAPELMSGPPLGRGLARVACVAWMAKSYVLKDWLAFAEVFGMPLRLGKYGPSATEEDIATLIAAVANLGTDAGAVIPESMGIEFVNTTGGAAGGNGVFEKLAEWADKQISKAVLGQTASADGTPGSLGNQDGQESVRDDLRDADAEELADTLNRDLVGAYLALNHGAIAPEAAPRIALRAKEPEDIKALADALAIFIPLGLRVEASVIRDKLGLPDPDEAGDDAEILGGSVAPDPAPDTHRLALHRQADTAPDTPDRQTAVLARAAGPLVDAMLGQIRRELDAAPDLGAFNERLLALYPELDGADLTELLGQAFLAGELGGRVEAS
jgi:phage gp29-like protein